VKDSHAKGSPFPDLFRAAFAAPAGMTPAEVADQIVACFRAVARLDRPTSSVFAAAMACIGVNPRDTLALAGSRIAAEIDRGMAGHDGNAYHNRQHTCEVALCSLFLARHAGLRPSDQARVIVAALVHDFQHDGTTNAGQPFRLERLAVAAARPHLMVAGVDAEEIERIAAIVLATEVSIGTSYARHCFRFFHDGGPPLDVPAEAMDDLSPLRLLAADADLAFQAVLLAEADLLPSAALTDDHAMLCQERLSREDRRVSPGVAEKLAFLDAQVPGLLVARFFEPNLEQQRYALVAALAGGAGKANDDTPGRT
jgi:hypothetical protein